MKNIQIGIVNINGEINNENNIIMNLNNIKNLSFNNLNIFNFKKYKINQKFNTLIDYYKIIFYLVYLCTYVDSQTNERRLSYNDNTKLHIKHTVKEFESCLSLIKFIMGNDFQIIINDDENCKFFTIKISKQFESILQENIKNNHFTKDLLLNLFDSYKNLNY